MIKNRSSLLGIAALMCVSAAAQITPNVTLTPTQLVQDVLLGSGVVVSNVSYNGVLDPGTPQQGSGAFTTISSNLGVPAGIILSSGLVQNVAQPGSGFQSDQPTPNFSDPDLVTITGGTINNAAVLEFDFVTTGDSIKFRYVFGSEEYPEWVCSFNDVFGFFLSGPGIAGPYTNGAINIALLPDGITPVSITFTTVLTASREVECGQTYHIKLAIGDALDQAFDSGVFLEAGSFTSTPFIPTLTPGPGIVGNNTILESCYPVTINFTQTGAGGDTSVVYILVSGTATPGVDYVPAFPDSLLFVPGDTTESFTFNAPIDIDGQETLILTLISESPCAGQTITNEFIFYIESSPPLVITGGTTIIPCLGSTTLVPAVSGGYPPYSITWSGGLPPGPTAMVAPLANTVYTATATDDCGTTSVAQFFVELEPLPPINMNIIGPSTVMEACESTTFNIIRPQGVPGPVDLQITFTGAAQNGSDFNLPSTIVIPDGVLNVITPFNPLEDNISDNGETVTIIATFTDDCGRSTSDSVTITIVDAPPIQLSSPDYLIECQADSLLLTAQASGGVGQLNLSWSNGDFGYTTYVTMQTPGTYIVTATDECGRQAIEEVVVTVECEVIIPNVITPNGDGYNDKWSIEGITYSSNTVAIYNRWGQKVYEATNYRNQWGGDDVPDGTYYYEVILTLKERKYTGSLTILRNGW
ncbi:MAG: choice-of-anchor L domain-containing protein [Flavobacteriales bacterium]|nr:choice-of-anchor L domain-containing protein [Flavobacteriales bacterium]